MADTDRPIPSRGESSGSVEPTVRERLCPPMPSDRMGGWLATIAVTIVAGVLRFWNLTAPKGMYFDEVYYTQDARGLMTSGYEVDTKNCVGPGYVVHPPLGKWFMAASEKIFGYTDCAGAVHGNPELGWRFSSALFGTIAVLVLARTARRMFRSTLLGCVAGLLLGFDGLEFVQSRIGILDIFLMTGLVVALACLVLDREDGRARLANRISARGLSSLGTAAARTPSDPSGSDPSGSGGTPSSATSAASAVEGAREPGGTAGLTPGGDPRPVALSGRAAELLDRFGPRLGVRPWRIAAGFFLGASMGVKWSALYTLIGFAMLALAWDVGARRTAGARSPLLGALRRDLPAWAGCFVLLPIVTFLATWTGWFVTDGGWDRHFYGNGFFAAWHGWWKYQMAILQFHEHLSTATSPHPSQSAPMSWLILGRPVAYFYEGPAYGEHGCTAAQGCAREVLALGNPAVWWVGTASLVAMLALWVCRRDWRAALVLVGFATSFLPWLAFPSRTMFFFYALPLLPFMVLGITASVGLALGPREASDTRRLAGALSVGIYLIAVVLLFAYFYPILAAQQIPLSAWRNRMWFPGWI